MALDAAPDGAPEPSREYAVQLSCGGCEAAVRAALSQLPHVSSVSCSLAAGTIVVEGAAPPERVLAALQATGRAARLVGSGAADAVPPHVGPPEENAAAVAEFKGVSYGTGPIRGVLRVAQLTGASVPCMCAAPRLFRAKTTRLTSSPDPKPTLHWRTCPCAACRPAGRSAWRCTAAAT